MNLSTAARFFDKTVCTDAYNPTTTFLGQLDLYDDSKRDGTTVERRILSTGPDIVIPTRRTLTIEGVTWIVGQKNIDSFQGKTIRNKYVIHQTSTLGMARTPKQLLSSGGLPLYASAVWLKDIKDVEASSKIYSFMNTYFAVGENVVVGDILTLGTDNYRLRNVYTSAAGVQIGEASTMPKDAIQSINYTSKNGQAYNAASDSYGAGVSTVFNTLWERFQDAYSYESAASPKYTPGDIVMVVAKSDVATPRVGDTLLAQGVTWTLVSFQDDNRNCWEMQVRRG